MPTNPHTPLCAHRWAVHNEPQRWQCVQCGMRCVTSEVNLAAGESFQAPYVVAQPTNTSHGALIAELADTRRELAETDKVRQTLARKHLELNVENSDLISELAAVKAERDRLGAALTESIEWHKAMNVGNGSDPMVRREQKSKLARLTSALTAAKA